MTRFALLPLIALAACTSSAQSATRGYSITDFDQIRVQGPFDVRVHVGGAAAAKATGPTDALDRLDVAVNGGMLVIKPTPGAWNGWWPGNQGRVIVDVVAPAVKAATLAGSGNVSIDRVRGDALSLVLAGSGDLSIGALDVTSLKAEATGSGDLTAAGRARHGDVMLTGSGDIHGDKLAVDDAGVRLVGSGDIALGAQHTAKVMLAGSGDIHITGPANCAITHSGSGGVYCAHQSAGTGDE